MTTERTREPQYQFCLEIRDEEGVSRLGLMANQAWRDDPRRLLFMFSRYKFVAKMLVGRRPILEVGCGDAFGTRLVLQETGPVTATDFDEIFVRDANERMDERWKFECRVHDFVRGPLEGGYEGAYALDVLEHIAPEDEQRFVSNIARSLTASGVLIIGTPSLQSQRFASPPSRAGHVNCKDAPELRELMMRFFDNVFMFSMNDEVVHTGYTPMAQYLLALCCTRRDPELARQ